MPLPKIPEGVDVLLEHQVATKLQFTLAQLLTLLRKVGFALPQDDDKCRVTCDRGLSNDRFVMTSNGAIRIEFGTLDTNAAPPTVIHRGSEPVAAELEPPTPTPEEQG